MIDKKAEEFRKSDETGISTIDTSKQLDTRETINITSTQSPSTSEFVDMERTSSKPSTPSLWFILMITIGMVTAGSLATILGKVMDQKVMIPDSNDSVGGSMSMIETEFKHPLLMNFLMFCGEASLLFVL